MSNRKFLSFKKTAKSMSNDLDQQDVSIDVNEYVTKQIRMIDLTNRDLQILKTFKPIIETNIEEITSSFYQTVLNIEDLKKIINDNSTVERLRKTLRDHIIEMFSGNIDDQFIQKRLKIAQVHQKIGLIPKWYMGAFQNLQNTFIDVIYRNVKDPAECLMLSKAITKLLNFEQQLVLEAYEKENLKEREKDYEKAKEEVKGQILSFSNELASLTEETSASVDELLSNSSEVKRFIDLTVEKTLESRSFSTVGQEKIKELEKQIIQIKESTIQMEDSVKELNNSSLMIKNIVSIVQNIANQTKILSFNAAIEAARAGEHGRGFSVVAAEVQKLSDETKKTVNQISEIISRTSQYTGAVVSSIDQVHVRVEIGRQESEETIKVFDSIIDAMESNIIDISKVESEMNTLVRIIDEIGHATKEAASSAENLNHTTQNM